MIGSTLSHFRITSLLGEGGMGAVYQAEDTNLDRQVAIKVLPEEFAQNPDRLARFEREAKAVAALSHPNILALFEFGQENGVTFAVTELLDGETVGSRLENGPMPIRKAIELARQVAEGLAAAHEQGVVHRDLKPDNLYLTRDGRAKILDFGLAKVATEAIDEQVTEAPTQTQHTDPEPSSARSATWLPSRCEANPPTTVRTSSRSASFSTRLSPGVAPFRPARASRR